jgi:hypothetical protein
MWVTENEKFVLCYNIYEYGILDLDPNFNQDVPFTIWIQI